MNAKILKTLILQDNDQIRDMGVGLLPNNKKILATCNKNIVILDSNLSILRKDTIQSNSSNQTKYLSNAIITKDGSIIGVGQNSYYFGLNQNTELYLKKNYIINVDTIKSIQSIEILGPLTITQKINPIQYNVKILPINASDESNNVELI
jgi:hypothetical protein